MDWFKTNLWELQKSDHIRHFGFLIALMHILTFIYWTMQGNIPLTYYQESSPICWSLIENCKSFRLLTFGQVKLLYYFYLLFSIMAGLLFLSIRLYGGGMFFLLLAFGANSFLTLQDSRLGGNEHYILFILTFLFLFIPRKATHLKYIIISIFVVSGILKLNGDWLSGYWILDQTGYHPKVSEWVSAIFALVETIAPWLLLSRSSQNIIISFAVLLGYNGYVWYVDGFYGPMLSILMLFYFPLYYLEQRKLQTQYIYQSYIRPEASQAWSVIVLLVFWSLQSIPFVQSVNPQVKKWGQALAMNEIPLFQECQQMNFKFEGKDVVEFDIKTPESRPKHLQCDPYIRYRDLKQYCRQEKKENPRFVTVASSLRIRGLDDDMFKVAFETSDICHDDQKFQNIGNYKWNRNVD